MAAITITAGSIVKTFGTPKIGTALGTITAGMALYKDGTRGAYGDSVGASDANGTANLRTTIGVSITGGSVGQAIMYMGDDGDIIDFGSGAPLTANVCYIAGATIAGDINPIADITTGWYLSTVGFATTTRLLTCKFFASGVAS